MIFRDDDISWLTNVNEFAKVHEFFNEYKQIHTIALLTKDIEKNPELINYINSQSNIDVQIHGYEHLDFNFTSERETEFQLAKSIEIIQRFFGKKPTTFFPPFNSINTSTISIGVELGLTVSIDKVGCIYYIKHNSNIVQNVINFHYHDYIESILIGVCLKLYSEKNKK